MKRTRCILFDAMTLVSLVFMVFLYLMPAEITLGRWFIYAKYGWIDVQKYSRPSFSISVPFWWAQLATLVFPVMWVVRRRAKSWWARASHCPGHCPACGYDMRSNPARCSECGNQPGAEDSGQGRSHV